MVYVCTAMMTALPCHLLQMTLTAAHAVLRWEQHPPCATGSHVARVVRKGVTRAMHGVWRPLTSNCMHVQGGGSCRNAVNASVCRFCDHHVQGEYKRLNSSRGPLMTATVAAQLGSRARAAGGQHSSSQNAAPSFQYSCQHNAAMISRCPAC